MAQRIIAFANQKGGVGKTTTVVSLAAKMAALGKKVCVVDMDPQGNATTNLGIKGDELEITAYDMLVKNAPLNKVVIKLRENLDVIPANIGLASAEVELATLAGKDVRLKKALAQGSNYDYILIDAPPSLNQLTLNALTAAKEVIVVVQTQVFSFLGLAKLTETIEMVREYTNPDLNMSGVVCTLYREQRNLNRNIAEQLRENFGNVVFKTPIRENVKLAEAPMVGQDIFSYDPTCAGAQDYAALCDEILAIEGV